MKFTKALFFSIAILFVVFVLQQINEEINWSVGDYLVAGLLFFLLALTLLWVRTLKWNKKYKFVYIFFLITAFLLLWVELAVGIFNSPFAGS